MYCESVRMGTEPMLIEESSLFFEINNSNGESAQKLPFDYICENDTAANELSFLLTGNSDCLNECPCNSYTNDPSSTIDLITFDTGAF